MFSGGLEIKPLEVNDFSGGMTDYFLQGDPKRYQRADNFWINVDKQLEVRWGSQPYDWGGHHILDRRQRVDAFLLFDQEREILPVQGRDIFYAPRNQSVWSRITGPSGNEALSAGDSYYPISSGEWRDHLYVSSGGFGLPSKIFKNASGEYQVRTAGLPRSIGAPAYTESSLLAACIQLANDIRSSMIQHIKDNANTGSIITTMVDTNLHNELDKYSLQYLETQSWSVGEFEYPGPGATAVGAATTEATLYDLVVALAKAYNHHGFDPTDGLYYHQVPYYDSSQIISSASRAPYEVINDTEPTTLDAAAERLNEIKRKWHWHRLGVYLHDTFNRLSKIDKYPVTAPKIDTIDYEGVLAVEGNYTDYLRYVNYLKHAYNLHVTDGRVGAGHHDWATGDGISIYQEYHTTPMNASDFTLQHWVTLPDAYDLDSAALIIIWVGILYGTIHYPDGNIALHKNFTADTTSGSASLADVKTSAGAITIPTTPRFMTLVSEEKRFNSSLTAEGDDTRSSRASASGSGTATVGKTANSTDGDTAMQYSESYFHAHWAQGASAGLATLSDTTAHEAAAGEALSDATLQGLTIRNSNLPKTTGEWVELAEEIFEALNTHAMNGESHGMPFNLVGYFLGSAEILPYPAISRSGFSLVDGAGPFFKPEIASYVYATAYKYEYTTEGGVEYVNISDPVLTDAVETGKLYPVTSARPSGITGIPDAKVEAVYGPSLTNIPSLANTANTNYDTDEIEVQIYRTIDSGNTYYLVDDLDNGDTTYTDTAPDSESAGGVDALDTRETLYTTGGVVENVQPPVCKYLHVVNDKAYFGYILDGGQVFKNRVIQSIPGTLDTGPLDFSVDLEDELVGLSSARKKPIAFSKTKVARLEGGYDERGQGVLTPESIADEIGCVSTASIVQTEIGVFFAGNDGFYYTDAYQIIKISIDLNETYKYRTKSEAQKSRIYGTYDRLHRRVLWTMQKNATDTDCDEIFVYYLDYGVKPSGVFTTMSNGTYFRPSAIAMYRGDLIRGDERGLILRHNPLFISDVKIPGYDPEDLSAPVADWGTVHIPYDYTSCALDFGTISKGQYVTKIHFLGANVGNFNMQMWAVSNNRKSTHERPMAPIRYAANPRWGDPTIDWGSSMTWKYDGGADFWRRFPDDKMRTQLKQVRFLPARMGVYKYDDYPAGSYLQTSSGFLTATLIRPPGYSDTVLPTDVIGMYVAFDNDDYTAEWEIVGQAINVVTVANPNADFPTLGSAKWVIRGYMKEAKLAPMAYAVHFAQFGERGQAYTKDQRGENA